jgi:hypothetical protein
VGGALVKVELGHGRGWAAPEPAKSIARIDRQLGRLADINEAGRSPEQANENRRKWLAYSAYLNGGPWAPKAPFALGADESVHCWGGAADSDDWYNAAAAAIWRDNGWKQTARYFDGNGRPTAKDEPWHGEYFAHLDNHRHEVVELINDNGTWRIAPDKEWDEMATEAQIRAVVADEVNKALTASKAITEKAVKQYSRAGAYKIVGVKGPKTSPGPHMYLTGPGGRVHLPTQPDVDLMRRYIQATAHVLDAPYNPKSASVNGEELLTETQFKTAMRWIARMKPEPEPVKPVAAGS